MSQYRTKEEFFVALAREATKQGLLRGPMKTCKAWVENQLREAERHFPYLQGTSAQMFFDYHGSRIQRENRSIEAQSMPTSQQFWRAAYDFDPFGSSGKANDDLVKMIAWGRVEAPTIGRLFGTITLKLLPAIGALPAAPFPGGFIPPFHFSATDSGAISYPDGHPTEQILFRSYQEPSSSKGVTDQKSGAQRRSSSTSSPREATSEQGLQGQSRGTSPSNVQRRSGEVSPFNIKRLSGELCDAPMSSRSSTTYTISPQEDDKLRRFAALGWVIQQDGPDDIWMKTGHILVIDMDDRAIRHRQPWLILASEWPTDGEETGEGTFTLHAEESVQRDDSSEPGVFPGDMNRTPICCIWPQRRFGKQEVVLNLFGDDFDFIPVRLGGHREAKESTQGPGLARPMEWYWDPEAEEEVCYTEEGLEYMRYDGRSKRYTYPNLSTMSFAGEQGLFGELQEEASLEVEAGYISLDARLGGMQFPNAPPIERRRKVATAAGF
ncbi:MAG: hypothetical protein Q9186_005965 [Xanthomendoza sp. 1 TL-2023]